MQTMPITLFRLSKIIMVVGCVCLVISIFQLSRLSSPFNNGRPYIQSVSNTWKRTDDSKEDDSKQENEAKQKYTTEEALVRTTGISPLREDESDGLVDGVTGESRELLLNIMEDLERKHSPTTEQSIRQASSEEDNDNTPTMTTLPSEHPGKEFKPDDPNEHPDKDEKPDEPNEHPDKDEKPDDPNEHPDKDDKLEAPARDQDTASSDSSNNRSKGPVHVLLLTEGRSGSTWLSSFFWHRPDVYYVFEPLFTTPKWNNAGCSDGGEKRKYCDQTILGSFWKCNFQSDELSILGRYPNYRETCNGCSMRRRGEICITKTHRVAKCINLFDLGNIADLVQNTSSYDIRVIQLVRDPRPLLRSRSQYGFGSIDGTHKLNDPSESKENQYKTVCDRMLKNSKFGDDPPDWLKNRYVRITHEDLSLHPIETAKMLYTFVDLEWTASTEEYIRNTTTGDIGNAGMFGIGKVSAEVIDKWKTMPDKLIESITNSCYDTLKYLGYETDLGLIKQWKLDNAELYKQSLESEGRNEDKLLHKENE